MQQTEQEPADLYDFVPWDVVARKAAEQDWLANRGYAPIAPSAVYFRGRDKPCAVNRYARYLRIYRLVMSRLGVALPPIPRLKELGLV